MLSFICRRNPDFNFYVVKIGKAFDMGTINAILHRNLLTITVIIWLWQSENLPSEYQVTILKSLAMQTSSRVLVRLRNNDLSG